MNPRPITTLYIEDRAGEGRRTDCQSYSGCLTRARVCRWPSFVCTSCDDYVAPTREDLRKDIEGMARLFTRLYSRR